MSSSCLWLSIRKGEFNYLSVRLSYEVAYTWKEPSQYNPLKKLAWLALIFPHPVYSSWANQQDCWSYSRCIWQYGADPNVENLSTLCSGFHFFPVLMVEISHCALVTRHLNDYKGDWAMGWEFRLESLNNVRNCWNICNKFSLEEMMR